MGHRKKEHLPRVLNEEYEFRDGLEQTDLDLSILVEDQIAKLQAWNNPAKTFFIMLCDCYFTYHGNTRAEPAQTKTYNKIKKEGKILH